MEKESNYKIIKIYLLKQIESGEVKSLQKIESENQLAQKFNLSRVTVRKAINDLVKDNLLFTRHGKGTFVAKKPKYLRFQCGIGFSQEMRNLNKVPTSTVVSLVKEEAGAEAAENLRLNKGEFVWRLQRIRKADGLIVAFEDEYFRFDLAPLLTEEICQHSVYDYLDSIGVKMEFADQSITAICADSTLQNHLEISATTALIQTTVLVFTKNGMPFNYGNTYYRCDRFTLMQSLYKKDLV